MIPLFWARTASTISIPSWTLVPWSVFTRWSLSSALFPARRRGRLRAGAVALMLDELLDVAVTLWSYQTNACSPPTAASHLIVTLTRTRGPLGVAAGDEQQLRRGVPVLGCRLRDIRAEPRDGH